MMCGQSIRRRLTPEQQDRNEVQEQNRYDELFAQVEEEQRLEYDMEFSEAYRQKHPFEPYGVHEEVTKRMQAEKTE